MQRLMKKAADLKAALDEHSIVAITDRRGRITFVNDKFCAISQYSREELPGQDHRIINSGYHSKEFFRHLWQTISSGGVWKGEFKNRAKDGSFYWVATTIVPLLNENGETHEFIAIGADVTKLKRVESELANSLRLHRLLADLSARFVALPSEEIDAAIHDTQKLIGETFGLDRSTLWQVSPGGEGMMLTHSWQRSELSPAPSGYPASELLPWAHSQVLCGNFIQFDSIDSLPSEASKDIRTFGILGIKSNVTIPLFAKGEVFGALTFASLGAEHQWGEDEIIELKLVGQIISNVVARQRAEQREEQLRAEMAHTVRVATMGELASTLAHELNQPLAAILSNAQAARRFLDRGENNPEELGAIFDDIIRDDKRAGNVIHNIRAMVSKRPADREVCSLNDLVEEVVDLMKAEFLAEKIDLRLALEDSLPLVECARVELQQVLVNFLVNAVHAMKTTLREARIIDLQSKSDPSWISVSVRDFGPGIPLDRLPRVFDPFFSTKANGLGMGLSICRRLIENHQGRIEADNHRDGGAIFCFYLPIFPTRKS